MDHTRSARAIAESLAAELPARGVALTGSVAAGTDHPGSDIDLIALTDTPREIDIRSVEGRMVTIGWKDVETIEAAFDRPREAPVAVAAWRAARLLSDPEGLLAEVKNTAEAWDWSDIAEQADRWVAESVVGLAEEANKIGGMLVTGNARAAAANRAVLVLQLPAVLAVADRVLYRTENELWDLVCSAEGEEWTAAWDTASGVVPATPAEACRAALRLYLAAAGRVDGVLSQRHRPVVATACRLARSHGA